MGFFSEVFDSSTNLAKDPFDSDKAKNQQQSLRSGLGTGAGIGERANNETKNLNNFASSNPGKSGSASDQMGRLLRAEWDDYINRFAPYDKKLIQLATSDLDNQQAIDRARAGVGNAFDISAGSIQRNNERLGLSNAGDVSSSLARQNLGSRTLAELNNINKTRLHASDRDKSILAGDAAAGLKSGRLTSE